MKLTRSISSLCLFLISLSPFASTALAQDQVETIQAVPNPLPAVVAGIVSGATLQKGQAAAVINQTLGTQTTVNVNASDFYCVIHILKWSATDPTKVDTQNWYVYHPGDKIHPWSDSDFKAFRIYGSKNFALLYIQLNHLKANTIVYKVEVTKKLPAPAQNLLMLLQIPSKAAPALEDVWGGKLLTINYVPSDVVVRSMVPGTDQTTLQEIAKQTYDDEGRYYWDVSIGIPVKGLNELQYNAQDGTVTSTQVSRQNIYAFLNIWPVPVDTKGTQFAYPQFLVGLPLVGKPLDKPFLGGGWGINKVQFFVGAVFNRVQSPMTLKAGSPATPSQLAADLHYHRETKLLFGLNLPVRQVVDALKSKK